MDKVFAQKLGIENVPGSIEGPVKFANIGAILNLIPLTGVPLPFFSYGSSSLIALLAGLGIVLNISRH